LCPYFSALERTKTRLPSTSPVQPRVSCPAAVKGRAPNNGGGRGWSTLMTNSYKEPAAARQGRKTCEAGRNLRGWGVSPTATPRCN
jgi:hypothetical protein